MSINYTRKPEQTTSNGSGDTQYSPDKINSTDGGYWESGDEYGMRKVKK